MRARTRLERCVGDVVPRCRNRRRPDTRRCHRCAQRLFRARNPISAAFATLRDHARERGIEFTITREQFAACAWAGEYAERKGNSADGLTVDRKDNTRGYVPGNIQPLTRSENSIKRAKYDERRMAVGMSWGGAYR